MSRTIALSQPIVVAGKQLTELTLRDVTTEDVFSIGLPALICAKEESRLVGIEFRMSVLLTYISRLASIPKDTVKKMAMRDVSQCQAHILSFFGNDIERWNHG